MYSSIINKWCCRWDTNWIFGVGGGFLIVPALVFITAMPIKRAINTSLLVIFVVSISGFISHYDKANMSWYIASMFIVGSAIGMLLATKVKKPQ